VAVPKSNIDYNSAQYLKDKIFNHVRTQGSVQVEAPWEPQNADDLHGWIKSITNHHIPRVGVCPDHDAPFDFLFDFYFATETDGIVLANRAGGKTEDVAALHLANGRFKPGFGTVHIGAIEQQAKRCYTYYKAGLRTEALRFMAPDPHIKETIWSNGSTIEILPGTEAQTQGPHFPLATFDEVEQGRYQPWENAKGIPAEWEDADGKLHPAQFLGTSTRQNGLGLMQRALNEAAEKGWRVYTWCVIETINGATCRDKAGNPLCDDCPLFNAGCEGRALNADGWRSRNEIVRVFNRVGIDTWDAQYLCTKPDAKALIYSNFTAANVTEEAEYVPEAGPIYLGYDWGFSDPTHIPLVQYRDGSFFQFDELVGNKRSEREWVREVVRRITDLPTYSRNGQSPAAPTYEEWEEIWSGKRPWPKPWPTVWPEIAAGDPSAVQLRSEFKEHGIGARSPGAVKHLVESGQDVLRAAISSAGNERRLYVHPRCTETIKSMTNYRAKELADGSFDTRPDPDPANHAFSHGADSLRYLMWTVRRALGLQMNGGDDGE
jgi:hypothetical protein